MLPHCLAFGGVHAVRHRENHSIPGRSAVSRIKPDGRAACRASFFTVRRAHGRTAQSGSGICRKMNLEDCLGASSRRGCCWYAIFFLGVVVGLPTPAVIWAQESWSELYVRWQTEYPDREAIEQRGQALLEELVTFVREHTADVERAEEVGKARRLTAEVLGIRGDVEGARRVWNELLAQGVRAEHRAFGLFALGQDAFFRERYFDQVRRGRRLAGAFEYWQKLTSEYPESPLSERVASRMLYLNFVRGGAEAPMIELEFEVEGERQRFTSENLRGKVVLIVFWKTDARGIEEARSTLTAGLKATLKEYPDLNGKVQVLGINLDPTREIFESTLKAWGRPWPELYGEASFRSPVVKAFAIPRSPHWVVIDPEGRVVFLGARTNAFLRAASQELRQVRQRVPR